MPTSGLCRHRGGSNSDSAKFVGIISAAPADGSIRNSDCVAGLAVMGKIGEKAIPCTWDGAMSDRNGQDYADLLAPSQFGGPALSA